MEGRIKRIDAVIATTTVIISAREERNYVPPQTPTFGTEVQQTWQDSMDTLAEFGKSIAIVLIAIIPWLPIVMLPVFVGRRLLRRRKVEE